MLTLTRKLDETVIITVGEVKITVKVIELRGGKVRLGIDAPREAKVDRGEVHERMLAEGRIDKPEKPPVIPVVRIGDKLPGEV